MRALTALVKREFFAYFFSPLAYVVLTAFTLINGVLFYLIVRALNQPDTPRTAYMNLFFTNLFYWIFLMIMVSVISMRLVAEERKSGSIETLLTAPVTEATVIVGKFLGGFAFFLFLWSPTILYPVLLSRFGTVDFGPVASGYLGIALLGLLFMAAGTLGSTVTKNQIVAAILAFGLIILLFFPVVFKEFVFSQTARDTLSYISVTDHMDEFARGIIDTRRIVYVLTTSVFLLFLSTKALEANKGR